MRTEINTFLSNKNDQLSCIHFLFSILVLHQLCSSIQKLLVLLSVSSKFCFIISLITKLGWSIQELFWLWWNNSFLDSRVLHNDVITLTLNYFWRFFVFWFWCCWCFRNRLIPLWLNSSRCFLGHSLLWFRSFKSSSSIVFFNWFFVNFIVSFCSFSFLLFGFFRSSINLGLPCHIRICLISSPRSMILFLLRRVRINKIINLTDN